MAAYPPLVDTHAHLGDSSFDPDRNEVINRARDVGVAAIVIMAETLQDSVRNLALAEQFPCLRPAAGLYPEFADLTETVRVVNFIRGRPESFCAIGEVGLDFWLAKDEETKELQQEVFRQFIGLAREFDLPLNVHSRSAGRQAVAMLLANNALRVQLHAFDGKYSSALPAVEAGFFFSIPPSVVRSRQKQKLLKHLPLSCLLVESDSPVLGPVPEKRNEPANTVAALQAISDIKNIAYAEAADVVLENTHKLYGRKIMNGL